MRGGGDGGVDGSGSVLCWGVCLSCNALNEFEVDTFGCCNVVDACDVFVGFVKISLSWVCRLVFSAVRTSSLCNVSE